MRLRILYFAALRERLGRAEEDVEVPAEVASIGALRVWLGQRGPEFASAFAPDRLVRAALNQRMVGPDAALSGGAEVAFFPPVTGG